MKIGQWRKPYGFVGILALGLITHWLMDPGLTASCVVGAWFAFGILLGVFDVGKLPASTFSFSCGVCGESMTCVNGDFDDFDDMVKFFAQHGHSKSV